MENEELMTTEIEETEIAESTGGNSNIGAFGLGVIVTALAYTAVKGTKKLIQKIKARKTTEDDVIDIIENEEENE